LDYEYSHILDYQAVSLLKKRVGISWKFADRSWWR